MTSTAVVPKGIITPVVGRTDISGLHYDVDHEVLYAVFDGAGALRAIQADGTLIKEWVLPGSDQEGIALDVDANNLFIAEDSGRAMLYSPFPAIPEPGATFLLAAGGLTLMRRRRRVATACPPRRGRSMHGFSQSG